MEHGFVKLEREDGGQLFSGTRLPAIKVFLNITWPEKGGLFMKAKIGFKRLLTLALMLCMVLALCLPAFGAGTQDAQGNTAVEEDKSGVLQVVTGVRDKESGKFLPVQAGTGFLVNETNVVTCSHVAFFDYNDEETKKYITETLDLSEKQADERKEIHISVYRDQTIKATVVTHSDIADLAVLKMEQPLKNRTYLKVNTGEIKPTAPCYTLGFLPPYKAIHSCVDMGASITMAKGAADAGQWPAVAIIGDSTFTHSGMTGLLDAINENANITVIISDNLTTGMTGGQDSAGTNKFEAIVRGLGLDNEHLKVVVPLPKNMPEITQIIRDEIEYKGVSVIIPRRECMQTLQRHLKQKKAAEKAAQENK